MELFALVTCPQFFLKNTIIFRQAEDIHWGKGLGCDFAERSCLELMQMDEERMEEEEEEAERRKGKKAEGEGGQNDVFVKPR